MDKLIPTDIYSHMGDPSATAGIEENQIPLFQFVATDLGARPVLLS